MRILFLGNNWTGCQVLQWLKGRGEEVVGLVLHPASKRQHGRELLEAADLGQTRVFDGSQLEHPETLTRIARLKPQVGISVFFGYILRPAFLALFEHHCLNLHPALLPYNRGAYPNVWSIVEGTPAGATLHHIDAGVDTGDIVAQRQVEVAFTDTGENLYHKLEKACVELFQEAWPLVREGRAPCHPQRADEGTYHKRKDVEQIDEIDWDRSYKAGDLINVLRARTFPPHLGAYFKTKGHRVYLHLKLSSKPSLSAERVDEIDWDHNYKAGDLLTLLQPRGVASGPGAYFEANGHKVYLELQFVPQQNLDLNDEKGNP